MVEFNKKKKKWSFSGINVNKSIIRENITRRHHIRIVLFGGTEEYNEEDNFQALFTFEISLIFSI